MSKREALQFHRAGCAIIAALSVMSAPVRAAERPSAGPVVSFRAERAGVVSINLYRADGTLVRRLMQSQRVAVGAQKIAWDGLGDDGLPVPPGEYTWKGLIHQGIGLKLRGWAANGGVTPWPTPDGKGDWGGDAGVPCAVAADAEHVYLGWSLAEQGRAILACDLAGKVQWGHQRADGASGCKALAVDGGLLFVLGGLAGTDAEGGAIYRLDAKDGKPVPWPNGNLDLKIASFWPADAKTKPEKADAMAVRHDHIYLTFTDSEFLAVLDAKTGAYLQTVVGAPPGQIDVVATKIDLPDVPGKLADADFAVISLGGGVLGKVLFAHDPLWVVTSELAPVQGDVRINALTAIGDGARFHRHEAFIGLGRPFHQIQARPLLDTGNLTWIAGSAGGRPLLGVWQAAALRDIRALALAADGRLWVAEGDAFPKRFSVWDTTEQQGKLVRELFGPTESNGFASAINPLDPDVIFVQGCEWRIDRQTGEAKCLGIVTREQIKSARFGVGENGRAYLVLEEVGGVLSIFERVGEGDYRLRTQIHRAAADGSPASMEAAVQTVLWTDENDDGGVQAGERRTFPGVLRVDAKATLQDLALTASARGAEAQMFAVQGWTACGAPRYDFAAGREVGEGQVSADGKLRLWKSDAPRGSAITCQEMGATKPRWSVASDFGTEFSSIAGVAKLPPPLGNLWLLSRKDAPWSLLNEDGFEIARFFAVPGNVSWPNSAKPGVDMMRTQGGNSGGLTQAVDGKLYLQAGTSAAWNLEVAGLDKVQMLIGGKVILPAAK
jgi:hypothetical protein